MKKKIIAYFSKHPTSGLKTREIAKKLNITAEHEIEQMKFYLHQLVEEKVLIKNGKKYLLNPGDTKKLAGQINIIDEGSYGFVVLKNSNLKDVFIPAKHLNTAFDGDLVEVSLLAKKRGKNIEGQIVKVLERKRTEFIGVLKKSRSFYFITADDKKIHREIYISESNLNGASSGDKVVVSEIEWKSPSLNPEGKISRILGKAGSYDSEIEAIAMEFNIESKFPKNVLAEVEDISDIVTDMEIRNRTDYRSKIVFTIDPDNAKDFDDAVSVEILPSQNYLIGIHIADVSHFVFPGTLVFEEASERATSVYLVGKVIPMLPEKLSNKICSLVPDEDRLTYSVFVEITPRARIIDYQIKKTIIRSKKRFTYKEVQNIIDNQSGTYFDEIFILNKIAKQLRAKRMKEGSINFHSTEIEFKLDNNGKPVELRPKIISESNNLIEEFMLLANKIVCSHIDKNSKKNDFTFVYRVHDKPDDEKMNDFVRFVKSLGYTFDSKAENKSSQFQKLIEEVKGKPEEAIINDVAIRSMAKAEYTITNIGHYGLGFQHYTHFTSPIRRFPDLLVHKLIYDFIENNKKSSFTEKQLNKYCKHSSAQERNAADAERLSVKLKQIEYLAGREGNDFIGIISGVTNFGLFVQIKGILAEGLIKIRDMEDDFYIYDEKNYLLKGKSKGRTFRLGDEVTVKLIRLDQEKRMIDFILTD